MIQQVIKYMDFVLMSLGMFRCRLRAIQWVFVLFHFREWKAFLILWHISRKKMSFTVIYNVTMGTASPNWHHLETSCDEGTSDVTHSCESVN